MTPDANHRLAAHIVGTWPDSVTERRALLTGLAETLPRSNEKRAAVLTVLATLDRHLIAPREFPEAGEPVKQ